MAGLEDRLRRLEERLRWEPTIEEYIDAKNRERPRVMEGIVEKLRTFPGFPAQRVFTEWDWRLLVEDTPERRLRDREAIEARYKAQGKDRTAEVEGAKEKLLAMLEAHSNQAASPSRLHKTVDQQ